MKSSNRGITITLSTILFLSITSVVHAQTPSRHIRDSQILPYLLDNPDQNSSVRVRCVPTQRQEIDRRRRMIRDSLLLPNSNTVTIEIEGNCRGVRIITPETTDFLNPSDFNDDWLIREGSGWNWLLHNRYR
jgi:hypothetical protein